MRALGLLDASDRTIFIKAKEAKAIIMSKDDDFLSLQKELGVPPNLIWVSCGNTSNQRMREVLAKHLVLALRLIAEGSEVIEIR